MYSKDDFFYSDRCINMLGCSLAIIYVIGYVELVYLFS